MTPYEIFASRLRRVRGNGKQMTAQCPAHDDRNNSLSFKEADDGTVLVKCFAGCDVSAIVSTLGLSMADLFPRKEGRVKPHPQRCNTATLTLAQYAKAKKLPVNFLQDMGLSDSCRWGRPAVRIPYRDEAGVESAVRYRLAMEDSTAWGSRFRWKKEAKPFLYGLWRTFNTDYIVLVEGESDCHTLWHHGIPALGVPGAGNWKEQRDARKLDAFAKIFVVIEPGDSGAAFKKWLAKSGIRRRAYLLEIADFKDPSELHMVDPAAFGARFAEAMKNALPYCDFESAKSVEEQHEQWNRCQHIAESVSILNLFTETIRTRGVVGEERAVKLLYLALTSRFLPRPVSVVVKGPSSGGKSFLVEQVLKFFPKSAVHSFTAMSERVLAYTDADLRHKFLVVFEAAGLSGDFATYLIRSLLSEGRIAYETVEKTIEGLTVRRIEKDGPTGLVTTTTAGRLHPENETRLFSLQIADTAAQTKAVLRSLAKGQQEHGNLDSWQAFQSWLEHSEHRVVIPFAESLAELLPPVGVRLRRDFTALLALIKANAILHQVSRQRNAEGLILATVEDYSQVRDLVADIMAEGVGATVSPFIRETVEAAQFLLQKSASEVALGVLASHLRLDKSSASRRITAAIQQGYLKNNEERRGRPARLVLGDPLPAEVEVLPTVEVLQCCSREPGVSTPPSPSTNGEAEQVSGTINRETNPPSTAEDAPAFVEVEF